MPGYRDVPTWACGPAPLIEAVQAAYDGSDAAARRVLQAARPVPPPVTPTATVVVRALRRRGAANTGATLLEQAEAPASRPEFGCRMGICFSCTSRKTEGTRPQRPHRRESSLPDEDIRICVTRPVGDCVRRPLRSEPERD